MVAATLEVLAEKLAESGVHSPTVSALVSGRLIQSLDAQHVLLCLGEPTRRALAHWFSFSWSTYASLVCLPSSQLGVDDRPDRHDLPLLTGHGCVVASRGVSGDPLAGMPVNRLRDELVESRQRLSEAAGYQVRWLAPTPTTLGTAVDGLVLEEARRAGYRRVLHPGAGLFDLDEDPIADQPDGCARLSYRPIQTDDTVDELVRWVRDERLSRPAARLRRLKRTPRRLLDRLFDS